jgi:adenosylmethionine-8-amino-7-oxononanoate aminotransferase
LLKQIQAIVRSDYQAGLLFRSIGKPLYWAPALTAAHEEIIFMNLAPLSVLKSAKSINIKHVLLAKSKMIYS